MADVIAGWGSATNAPPSSGANSANSNLSQTEFGQYLPIINAGDIDAIYIKSSLSVTNKRAAIYRADAGSSTLTGRTRLSGDLTPPTAGAGAYAGWHKYVVSPAVTVSLADTAIWIVGVATSTTYDYTDFATTGGSTKDTTGITTLATPHPTTTSSFSNRINVFAEGTIITADNTMKGANTGMFGGDLIGSGWF